MITFRCTQKARKVLGLTDSELWQGESDALGDWFVETATFDHQRHLLFTNAVSLYGFWVRGVRKADRTRLGGLFASHLRATMAGDGFTERECQAICRSGSEFRFAKTNNRSVTGSMNDHVQCSRWYFDPETGPKEDLPTINARLNHTPMGALAPGQHLDFPVDVLARIVRRGVKMRRPR
jgi:hypothetical protein